MPATTRSPESELPEELSPRRLRRRLLEFAVFGVLVAVFLETGPGIGGLRRDLRHATGGWLLAGIGLEVLSLLAYVVIFRAVYCPRMNWRVSYQIALAEQAANSLLPASGAGGLALGVWALRRGGMSTEHIGRRTVAFFFLTSLANVAGVVLFAVLYATGALEPDRSPGLTYGFGAAAAIATAIVVVGLPRVRPGAVPANQVPGRIARGLRFVRNSLGSGVRDGLEMLRRRPITILAGSFGVTAFDLAVLGVCFKAFHHSPPIGVLVLGYLIGQLGGNIPIPGGIGGLDAGLIGTFVLYHQPLAVTSAAVLIYHAISLWVPALLGTGAFVQFRRTLQREAQPAALCAPLAEPVVTVLPTAGGAGSR